MKLWVAKMDKFPRLNKIWMRIEWEWMRRGNDISVTFCYWNNRKGRTCGIFRLFSFFIAAPMIRTYGSCRNYVSMQSLYFANFERSWLEVLNKVGSKFERSRLEVRTELARNSFEVGPKFVRSWAEVHSKLSWSSFEVEAKFVRSSSEVRLKLAQSSFEVETKFIRSWVEVRTKWTRSSFEVGPRIVRKLTPSHQEKCHTRRSILLKFKWTVGYLLRVMVSFSEYKRQRIVSDVEWTYSIFFHCWTSRCESLSGEVRMSVSLPRNHRWLSAESLLSIRGTSVGHPRNVPLKVCAERSKEISFT